MLRPLSRPGVWNRYLSPDQTAIEMLFNIVWGIVFFVKGDCLSRWGEDDVGDGKGGSRTRPLDVYDKVLGWICVV